MRNYNFCKLIFVTMGQCKFEGRAFYLIIELRHFYPIYLNKCNNYQTTQIIFILSFLISAPSLTNSKLNSHPCFPNTSVTSLLGTKTTWSMLELVQGQTSPFPSYARAVLEIITFPAIRFQCS